MSRIPVGIVGCGYWGPNLVRNFFEHDQVELKYVCDLDFNKLCRVGKRYPSATLTTNLNDLLIDPEVAAIAIATPVRTHFPLAKKALLANKHVLVEKPMCQTSDQCAEIIAIAEEKNLVLMVDHTFVYNGAIRRIKEEIDRGELGHILYFDSVRINLGLFQSDVNVIWDLAPHDLSIMDYLLGCEPTSVHATGTSHTGAGKEDIAYISLGFADGLIAHFHVSWLSPVKVRQLLIGGTRKMIAYDDLQATEKVRIYDKGIVFPDDQSEEARYENLIKYRVGDMHAPVFDLAEALKVEVAHFIDCIDTGKKPLTDGQAGLRLVRILESVDRALATGQIQEVDLAGATR